jgi:hypothetical protein
MYIDPDLRERSDPVSGSLKLWLETFVVFGRFVELFFRSVGCCKRH